MPTWLKSEPHTIALSGSISRPDGIKPLSAKQTTSFSRCGLKAEQEIRFLIKGFYILEKDLTNAKTGYQKQISTIHIVYWGGIFYKSSITENLKKMSVAFTTLTQSINFLDSTFTINPEIWSNIPVLNNFICLTK